MVEMSRGQQRGKAVGLGTVPPVQLGASDTAARASTARDRIVTIAEASVLAKGFAATSIEEVVTEAGITKSGFFYHFKDKNELAHEMIRRYVASNDELFDDLFGRARELTDDPLQAFLLGLKMLSEVMRDLPSLHPGCLIASVCYQERLFDRRVKELTESSVKSWNERFLGYLTDIEALYPRSEPVSLEDAANMLSCVVDGGIIMGKALKDPKVLERQVLAYRSFIKLLFARPAG